MGKPLRVLIVEDSRADAQLLLHELRQAGYDPAYEVVDSPEAMNLALDKQSWDIVLADYAMPAFSGIAALELLQSKGIDVPFIVVSGHIGEDIAVEVMKAGAHDYILKGKLARLVPAIQREMREAVVRRERKEADEALRKAHAELERRVEERTAELAAERQRLAVTLSSIGDGVIATDMAGKVVLINRIAEQLTGWSQEEAAGRHLREVFHIVNAKTRERCEDPVDKVFKTGTAVGLANDTVLIARDGTERIIDDSGAPIRGADGETLGAILVFSDSTERKRAEEAVRESEAWFRAVFEGSALGIALVDVDGRPVASNPALQEMLGYSGEELRGRVFAEFTHPEDVAVEASLYEEAVAGKRDHFQIEKRYIRKDGELIWCCLTVSLIRDLRGGPYFGLCMVENITSRKRSEEERERLLAQLEQERQRVEELAESLRRERDVLEVIMASTRACLVYLDPQFNFLRVNRAYEDTCNRSEAEFLGHNHFEFYPHPENEAIFKRVVETGQPAEWFAKPFEFPDMPWRGITYWDWTLTPIKNTEGQVEGLVFSLVDVTERIMDRQRIEELLANWQREAVEREDLIRSVSHDLRNPLTVILGQAQLLQRLLERAGQKGPEWRAAEAIITSARRMNGMIQDLTDSARLEANQLQLEKQPVKLVSLVTELMERSATIVDIGRIKLEIPADLPAINCDPGRVERIILNLLTNALKYSHPETDVLVRAASIGSEVMISVADRGTGIAPEDLTRIFDRYYRAGDVAKAEGLGLGLYIAGKLVEAHSGRIWAESELDLGSTFFFTLPIT